MSTDYLNSAYLNRTPTGFGTYTGFWIVNSGNAPVNYELSISNTEFISEPTESQAVDNTLYNTIFISDGINNFDGVNNNLNTVLNSNESGLFYIFHNPFSTFKPANESTGLETAVISIYSNSNFDSSDNVAVINVTGQRVLDFEVPDKVSKFYGFQNYNSEDGYNLQFNWSCISGYSYITGFRLDLSNDSDFSTYTAYYAPVTSNTLDYLPDYGNYSGFLGKSFSLKIGSLSFSQNYYSRITSINGTGGTGAFTYPTGFFNNVPIVLDKLTYSGLHPSPGANLIYTPQVLDLEYKTDFTQNFDLANFLVQNNNGSYDFSYYSGANIKISPSQQEFGVIQSSDPSDGAIKFIPEKAFTFNTGEGGVFKLNIEFENMRVYGAGGAGVQFNADGGLVDAQDGGPVFKFDNLNYTDAAGGFRKFEYHIKKDVDSLFYVGLGGGDGFQATNTTDVLNQSVVEGESVKILDSVNLRTSDIVSVSYQIQAEQQYGGQDVIINGLGVKGAEGNVVGVLDDTKLYPDLFLGFKQRRGFLSNNIIFRFSSDDIAEEAGTTTNFWRSQAGTIKAPFSLLNSTYNSLEVRQAYGKKFYELLPNSDFKISSQAQIQTGAGRPSYTILVFALAKENLDTNENSTYVNMFANSGRIHKFINISSSDASSEPLNFLRNGNTNLYKSTFCGTPLACSTYYDVVRQVFHLKNYSDYWVNSNVGYSNRTYILNPSASSHYADDLDLEIISNNSVNPLIFGTKTSFRSYNIQNLRNFDSPATAVDFEIDDGSGTTNFKMFSLFFVQMHSEIAPRIIQTANAADNAVHVPVQEFISSSKDFLTSTTIINGLQTSSGDVAIDKRQIPYAANCFLHLANPTNESLNKTRLFLFDYLYGTESTVEKRDLVSKNIIENLASNLSPILLKSSSNLKIAGMYGDQKRSVEFPSVLAHQYLNIFSS